MRSKIYIAGKISGDENYKAKFAEAEDFYKKNGYTILNPAVLPAGMRPEDYMRICFAMIDTADAVSFLPDYVRSEGALVEHAYCCYTDKMIRHYEEDNSGEKTDWLAVGKAASDGIHAGLYTSPKYGEWLFEYIGGHKVVTCTACQHADGQFEPNGCMHYCPYCGARITARR